MASRNYASTDKTIKINFDFKKKISKINCL